MIPAVRRDGTTIVGRTASYSKRWVGPRLEQVWMRFVCWLFGHDWSAWEEDDYDGPGEELEEGGFMSFCRRESAPGTYGERICQRYCGTHEQRYPIAKAPTLWVGKLMAEEAGEPFSVDEWMRSGWGE